MSQLYVPTLRSLTLGEAHDRCARRTPVEFLRTRRAHQARVLARVHEEDLLGARAAMAGDERDAGVGGALPCDLLQLRVLATEARERLVHDRDCWQVTGALEFDVERRGRRLDGVLSERADRRRVGSRDVDRRVQADALAGVEHEQREVARRRRKPQRL